MISGAVCVEHVRVCAPCWLLLPRVNDPGFFVLREKDDVAVSRRAQRMSTKRQREERFSVI